MAGMTPEGLEILRQGEVIQELREQAVPIFQDLVPVDDTLDTSDSSTIGRLTGLLSIPLADLWEAVQEVYLAFDPNSAYGTALDNLVAYGGLTRNPASPTTVTLVMWGSENTLLPAEDTQVRSTDGNLYYLPLSVIFNSEQCSGVRVTVNTPVAGRTYGVSIVLDNTTVNLSYTAVSGDTSNDVLNELYNDIAGNSLFNASVANGVLEITTVDVMDYISVTLTGTGLNYSGIRVRTEGVNTEVGAIPQAANTVNIIATPVLGWESVNNPFAGVTGREQETDEELRIRFRDSKFIRAQNIGDSLYSTLLEIDGVTGASIYENEGDDFLPEFDLPGHSFRVVILGGNPSEIATAIWNNKPLGISSEGNTVVQIFDSQGFTHDIRFDRPESVPIEIHMDISTIQGEYPADGATRIRNALISYFQNEIEVGEDVVYSRLYTPINSVPGHQVNSLTVGRVGETQGTSNVSISYAEIATITSDDIYITVT